MEIRKVKQRKLTVPARKRVAAYARVSGGKDAMLHSLSAQVSHYSALIQRKAEWEYAGVYADEAMTGTKDSRSEFRHLVDDCKAGRIDMVITKSISRFARNTLTLLETVRELKDAGVDVYFEEQNIYTMSADGELMLTILASYAQEESLSASENCLWRIRERFRNGEPVGLFTMSAGTAAGCTTSLTTTIHTTEKRFGGCC
jgi:DNA invertase Pin-like site-specific DNA recombinase